MQVALHCTLCQDLFGKEKKLAEFVADPSIQRITKRGIDAEFQYWLINCGSAAHCSFYASYVFQLSLCSGQLSLLPSAGWEISRG